ncbi:Ltp family lipoprotein [Ruminococcus sp.]|uniref:Ltp family lipoprotein n=1 Tax=Ruminococcus sp. TaxID=41978 RepID=UPI001B449692|nr:Ltp family lipoprotein [Ruminococcus sp.]MBP5432129.1 Ltp family lipoprotein [Ruminococcus sp.]
MGRKQAQNYVYEDNPNPKFCKKCRYCKQIIDKKASVCPFCNRAQPIIPPWVCIIILLAIASMCCCFFKPGGNKEDEDNNSSISETRVDYDSLSREEQAAESAKIFLNALPYSRSSMISQLELDGFTHEESEYGADHCGANYNEEAVEAAKFYSYESRDKITEYLKDEGFTDEQIQYALSAVNK